MAEQTTKLKIGLVLDTTLDTQDGVPQYVLAVGEWLKKQGHDVRYVVGQTTRNDISGIISVTKNITLPFNGNRISTPLPARASSLKKVLAAERFDVLHVQIPHSPFMAQKLLLAADTRTAVVGTFHILPTGTLATVGTKILGIWLRKSKMRFDAVFSVSKAAQKFAKKTFGIDSQVLPNVFDYQLFHNAQPFDKYTKSNAYTILFLGRLVPRKGCQTLLEAAKILANDNSVPNFKVVVCGKGPLLDKLTKQVHDFNLDEIVSFEGFVSVEDKPRYYASADISVFPSSGGESFGIVLLEAMASGHAAVLAGDNPGYASVLEPRRQQLFAPTDAVALASKLKALLLDESFRSEYATWGEAYTKNFDTEYVGTKIVTAYRDALHKRRQE